MQVYIEDAIFDTTIINFVILYLTLFSLRQKVSWLKTIMASLVGTIFSLALTFVTLPLILTIVAKIITGLVMIALSTQKLDIKSYIVMFLVFISFTFLMGGFCFFIIYLLGGEVYSLSKMSYNLPISLGLITFLIAIYVYFLINVVKIFYKKQKIDCFYYNVNLTANNKTKKIKAYLDSGNLLQDPNTGQSILVLSLNNFLELFKDKINIVDCLNSKLDKKINGKYINFSSVSLNQKMFVFEPNKVEILKSNNSKQSISVLVGVSSNNFSKNNFDALLSPLSI